MDKRYIIGFLTGYGILTPDQTKAYLKHPDCKYNGTTLLMHAIEFPLFVEKLLDTLYQLDDNYHDAIWHAVNKNCLGSLEILLEYNCNINGELITLAIQNINLNIIKLFLSINKDLVRSHFCYAKMYRDHIVKNFTNADLDKNKEKEFNEKIKILDQIIWEIQ